MSNLWEDFEVMLRAQIDNDRDSVGGSGIPEVTFRQLPFAEHRTFAKRSHVKDRKGFDMTYFGSTRVVDQASAHSLPLTVAGRHTALNPTDSTHGKPKSFGFEFPVLTKESGKQRIAAVSSVESPLRRVRIRLRTPPSSLRKPRVSGTTSNRAFLRGFPASQFPDFGLCGRSRILVAVFGASSPPPKIPFPAAVVQREVRPQWKPQFGLCTAVTRDGQRRGYSGLRPSASNCRLHSVGGSRSRSMLMPRGRRPSMPALARFGARKASEQLGYQPVDRNPWPHQCA